MAHLKSTKSTNVSMNRTGSIVVNCNPEIMIGVLQKPDGSYAAYGYHFYTDDQDVMHQIQPFEESLSEEVVNQLAQLVDTTGMSETERRHAQLVVGAKAILTQKNHWGLVGSDYEEVISE